MAETPGGWLSKEAVSAIIGDETSEKPIEPTTGITLQRLSEVERRSINFLDPPLLQADAFTLLVGRKGVGKGTYLAHVASRLTRGELGAKCRVVWIGSEDSAAIDIGPRIDAAGGDPERVMVVKEGWLQLPRDLDWINEMLAEQRDVGLLVIDPIGNHIMGKESNSESDVREAIGPLNKIADDHQCIVIGVRHVSEKEASRGATAAILGSSAWVQVPRQVNAVVRDDENAEIVHVACIAGNRVRTGTSGREYRIEGMLVPGLDTEVTHAVPLGESSKNVETLLATASSKLPSKSAAARELILDILEAEGEQESDALDARVASETGVSANTVQNQRGKLGKNGLGLVKNVPENNPDGTFKRWMVCRTAAPRDTGNAQ